MTNTSGLWESKADPSHLSPNFRFVIYFRFMLRHKIYSILLKLVDQKPSLRLTSEQLKLTEALRVQFEKLPVYPVENSGLTTSEAEWNRNMNRLRELILTSDPVEFLRWDVIRYTMFLASGKIIADELNEIKTYPPWKSKWRDLVREDRIGNPIPYLFYPSSSGNRIHHLYHLMRFEKSASAEINSFNTVFEFGGGYGSLCRLIHRLSFKGKYIIFDLPHFSLLQQYYLTLLDIKVRQPSGYNNTDDGVFCISSFNELDMVMKHVNTKSLFIATWSLSESPLEVREKIVPHISSFKNVLIGFQNRFGEMNNYNYFKTLTDNLPEYNWKYQGIPALKDNNYLFGCR